EVLLTDWGLAMAYSSNLVTRFTSENLRRFLPTRETASSPAGTLAFMAPEQTYWNCEKIGPWTDIYLLGGCLYYLLTGALPHDAPDSRHAFHQATTGTIKDPMTFRDRRFIPSDLAKIVRRAMAQDP